MTKTGICDVHTHIFPRDIPEKWDWYAAQDKTFAALTDNNGPSRVKEVFSTPEETLACADEAGVELIVMQGWYWNSMALCRRHNDFMAEVIRDYPDRFAAFAAINPTCGEEAVEEVYRCRELGFAGVGELGPGGNHFALDDPGLIRVLEACDKLKLPVNFHVGEPIGHVYPGKDLTPLAGFYDLAERFPSLTMILAHMGGGLPYYELMPEVRRLFKNVVYDLAANPLLYDIRSVKLTVDLVGADKVLFGTDFPLTIYPRQCLDRNFSLFVDNVVENSGLSEEELTLVMRENCLRVLGRQNGRA